MGGLKMVAYLSLTVTSIMGPWGLCSTWSFLQGQAAEQPSLCHARGKENLRGLVTERVSPSKIVTPTHSPLARTNLWSQAITREQRVQFSLCTEGKNKQDLQEALWTTIVPWGPSSPMPSGFRRGNAARTEQQRDSPHVAQLSDVDTEEGWELGFSSALNFSNTALCELVSCNDCFQFT